MASKIGISTSVNLSHRPDINEIIVKKLRLELNELLEKLNN
ncbi:hypothetical protein NMY3_03638 [Candidatus Nitrosocosmicus oleophilus]|jgi:hypothetical protein|uniref:Uncharacterized protein n=1 Tax=Candidatus Nitrosocosmicus oleophilus TaxID=1353260 RepID=A0A654M3Z4_9ARCH|nr:hypothetical protein NMY3_03638 [Candidatus Nitrosocosmicus oleophilus]